MIRFTLVGPLRTGSSLLARCLDDHPGLFCLCESEINRALFGEYFIQLHFQRMRRHGLGPLEITRLLNRRRQESIDDYEGWHRDVVPILSKRYGKTGVSGIGDKSPDFYRTPRLARHVLENHRLIYTIRDPRAVYRSIQADRTSDEEKENRWKSFLDNVRFWERDLQHDNVRVVRYEDLVESPDEVMHAVCSHIGIPFSSGFRDSFPRMFPERFLWKGATEEAHQGVRFDRGKKARWKAELAEGEIQRLEKIPEVETVLHTFDYPSYSARQPDGN